MDTDFLVIGADFLTVGGDFLIVGEGLPPAVKSLQLKILLRWEGGVLQIDGVGDWID